MYTYVNVATKLLPHPNNICRTPETYASPHRINEDRKKVQV